MACVCAMALLAGGCTGDGEERTADTSASTMPSTSGSPPTPAERDTGEVNRRDVNGDGHADAVVNGWYKYPKTGGKWFNNRFIAFASRSGLDPAGAFGLSERFAPPDPRVDSSPIFRDVSEQFTGDLDDDGHADIVVRNRLSHPSGKYTPDQRIIWGGPRGATGTTGLPSDVQDAVAVADFDGDGALDLLTLGEPSSDQDLEPQQAVILHGPLARDKGVPRTTTSVDVGHDGWVPVAHVVAADFDGDGRDDLVTKAKYDEEDARFEDDDMPDVDDAAFYRAMPQGLKEVGSVPGITSDHESGMVPVVAGDFDGDGRDDILGRTQVDEAVAVYGSANGPGRGRSATSLGKVRLFDAVVGDVDGDGRDDVATQTVGSDRRVGEVTVLLGGPRGLSEDRVMRIDRYSIGLGGSPRHEGDRDRFGWDLHLADLDIDGRDELLIGTFGFNKPRKEAGYWILTGTKTGPSTSDRRFVRTRDFGRG